MIICIDNGCSTNDCHTNLIYSVGAFLLLSYILHFCRYKEKFLSKETFTQVLFINAIKNGLSDNSMCFTIM